MEKREEMTVDVGNKMFAKDCKCCKCDRPAVAFWPVVDPDIPSHPYCRECLDEAKLNFLMEIQNYNKTKLNP